MKQFTTTLVYVVIAAVVLSLAWFVQSTPTVQPVVDDAGERFFPQFDPLAATTMQVVRIDEETAQPTTFRVTQVDGKWTIPSHDDYPADGADRLARVAVSVMDVTKGAKASDSPSEHALFGVLDPAADGVDPAGAGTHITLEDSAGKPLVDLIVGKAVKDAPQLRYVRTPGRDRVYAVSINIDSATTKFEDWIEPDLLQLDPAQIASIGVDDYTIDEINQRMITGDVIELSRNAASNTWSLKDIKENETLNQERVRELTTALDDLRIVDVHRKPKGLSAQLALAEGLQLDNEAIASLADCGYYIAGNQLLSNEGQTTVRMTDGVEYTLRFGEIALYKQNNAADNNSASAEAETNPGRYVFVTASFNPNLIEKPEMEPWPEMPPEPVADEQGPPSEDAMKAFEAAKTERERITALNDQRTKAYNDRIKAGQERAKKLSERFAPWYYVVPDSVYQQIRLKRPELVAPPDVDGDAPTPMLPPNG